MIRGSLFVAALTLPVVAAGEAGPCAGTIYLTFDTGNMAQAEDIAQVLAAEQVRATFFLANEKTARGDHALDASWAAYWRARVAEGHVCANPTWSHHYQRRDLDGERIAAAAVDGRTLEMDRQAFCAELRKTDVIVSNPPYIAERDLPGLQPEVQLFEPHMALVSGPLGTEFHRRLLQDAPAFLVPGGMLMMEIGQGQAAAVRALAQDIGGYAPVVLVEDAAGIERVVIAQKVG